MAGFWDTLPEDKGGGGGSPKDEDFWGSIPADKPEKPTKPTLKQSLKPVADVLGGTVEAAAAGATGMVGGVAGALTVPLASAYYGGIKGDKDWQGKAKEAGKKVSNALTYKPYTESGKGAAEVMGKVGEVLTKPGELIEKGGESLGETIGLPSGLGTSARSAYDAALMTGKVTPASVGRTAARAATSVIPKGTEASMMERAIKPNTTLKATEREARVETALREGIPTTKRGVAKSKDIVNSINREIEDRIDAYTTEGAKVNKKDIVGPVKQRMGQALSDVAFPEKARRQVNATIGEFERNAPDSMTLSQTQKGKQSIHKELNDFYDALATSPDKSKAIAQKWTNKTKAELANEMRREVAEVFPEVKGLNAREGALLNLNKSMERAVNRISQHDLLSLKGLVGLVVHPKYAVMNYVLNNPAVQSNLAIALRRTREYGKGGMQPTPSFGGLDSTYKRAVQDEAVKGEVGAQSARSGREREYYRTMPINRNESMVPSPPRSTAMVPTGQPTNILVGEQTSTLPLGFASREVPLRPSIPMGAYGAATRQGRGPIYQDRAISAEQPYGRIAEGQVREAQSKKPPAATLPYEDAKGGRYPVASPSRPPVRSPERYTHPEPTGPRANERVAVESKGSIVEARADYQRFRALGSTPPFLWSAEDKAFFKRYTSGKGKGSKSKPVVVPQEVWREIE